MSELRPTFCISFIGFLWSLRALRGGMVMGWGDSGVPFCWSSDWDVSWVTFEPSSSDWFWKKRWIECNLMTMVLSIFQCTMFTISINVTNLNQTIKGSVNNKLHYKNLDITFSVLPSSGYFLASSGFLILFRWSWCLWGKYLGFGLKSLSDPLKSWFETWKERFENEVCIWSNKPTDHNEMLED